MRRFWTTFAMVAATAAACSETNDADDPAAGGGGGGPLAGSAGANAAGGKSQAHASAGSAQAGTASGGITSGGQATQAGAGAAGSPSEAGANPEGGAAGAGGAGGEPTAWQFRALTYNTALAPDFEPLTAERSPQVQAALADAAKQLDLVCVQEYWSSADFAALQGALVGELPHAYRQPGRPGTGSCSPADLGELGGCLAAKCPQKQGIELVECAQIQCSAAIQHVDGGCLGCFLEHLDGSSAEACLADAPSDPALFGGTFDVGLLSRYPLLQQAALEYDAYFVRASALYAQVDVPGLGLVDTFCTHLGSSLGVIPYRGPHGSWNGEHAYQVAQLLGFVSARASGQHPVLLLGDLNTGPASAGPPPIQAELPLDYQLLLGAGFDSAMASPQCTLCSDNALRSGNSRETWLDHALIRGFPGAVLAERALTQTFELGTAPNTLAMNLSDHYGLRVRLSSE